MTQRSMGRGIIKWQPFASIPQQFAGVRNIIDDQNKVPKPILDETEQERINFLILEAIENDEEIALVFWKNGRYETKVGKIKKIDVISKVIHIKENNYLLPLNIITDVYLIQSS